jgi:hypothetical protein
MKKSISFFLGNAVLVLTLIAFGFALGHLVQSDETKSNLSIPLPEGAAGIGFDDIQYSPVLNRVLIPSGRTGKVNLLDPQSVKVTSITGFSAEKNYKGGHGEGVTSISEGMGLLFITDRSSLKLDVVDPSSKAIIASASLASSPDYVRFVSMTNEIWVTEPENDQIEVFAFSDKQKSPLHSGFVQITGGPESLVIDHARGRAYTHLWQGKTVAIDVKSRAVVATWSNSCKGSRGIALEETKGILFIGCSEGKAVSMNTNDGKIISSLNSGSGVDIIDYNPILRHLYLPGATSGTMAIINVSSTGALSLLGTTPTISGAHCVTSDHARNVYVCDPHHGKILIIQDKY